MKVVLMEENDLIEGYLEDEKREKRKKKKE